MKAAGLPESLPGKPALFLDKLILRKQTPEKPAEVNLDVVVRGLRSLGGHTCGAAGGKDKTGRC